MEEIAQERLRPQITGELLVLELNGMWFIFRFLVLTTVYISYFLSVLFP